MDSITDVSYEAQPTSGPCSIRLANFSDLTIGFSYARLKFVESGLPPFAQNLLLSLTPSRLQSSSF